MRIYSYIYGIIFFYTVLASFPFLPLPFCCEIPPPPGFFSQDPDPVKLVLRHLCAGDDMHLPDVCVQKCVQKSALGLKMV